MAYQRLAMTQFPIPINEEKIDACCKKHHITYLALFGSILTSHFSTYRDVDIKTPNSLSRHFRYEVLSKAKVLYGK